MAHSSDPRLDPKESRTGHLPRVAIVYRRLSELKLNPHNPRIHSAKQIRQIGRSIKAFGPIVPIVVDRNCEVIAGAGRVLAGRQCEIEEFPTICVEHLTEAQARAFAIADNRLTENSVWDERLLAEQLKSLSELELDFSLDVTGFEVAEIDLFIQGLAPAIGGETDPADTVPEISAAVPVSRLGDLWLLGANRIFCGDALDSSSYSLSAGKPGAMAITDPPYNVPIAGHASGLGIVQHQDFKMASGEMSSAEYTDFLEQACKLLRDHTSDGSLHYLFIDWRHMGELTAAGAQAYTGLTNVCVWVKDNAGMGSMYRSQHELVFVFKNGKAPHRNNIQLGTHGRYRSNVWQYPGMNSFSRSTEEGNLLALHPTPKPVALVADAIMDSTARGEIVIDPFLGSGTTVIAAERTGRMCYGIEIDPVYVDVAVRRWQTFTGLQAMHSSSGRSFNELEKEVRVGNEG